jgi:hypothetical protein
VIFFRPVVIRSTGMTAIAKIAFCAVLPQPLESQLDQQADWFQVCLSALEELRIYPKEEPWVTP